VLANIPILRGDYSVECAVIVLALLVIALIRQQRFALWVFLFGIALLVLPFVLLYAPFARSVAGQFPYDLVWGVALPTIVVGAFGLCFRFWRRAAE